MLSWSEAEVTTKENSHKVVHTEHQKQAHHHKANQERSEQDINQHNLSKYSDDCLKILVNLLEACIARNELKDTEDLEKRLKYQRTRGGTTPCGAAYSGLSMSHYLNLLEDETREMKEDVKAAKAELTKRGHKCGCKTRG